MLSVEETVLVLLAAGRSARFGDVGSKLGQDFLGKPLGLHVAVALEDLPFAERVAVVNGAAPDYAAHGFRLVHNREAEPDMANSVRLGIGCARARGARAVLLALADMPRVTAAHVHRLFDASAGADTVVASSDGCDPKPPALFGADRFDALMQVRGDRGARDLVRAGRHVVTAPAELIDVDTPDELERLRALVGAPDALTRAGARRSG
jgi:molybdenum cofactor cytidylyltransferase